MKNKAVIFDIDNTLLNDDLAVESACKILYKKYSKYLDNNFESFLADWFSAIEKYFPKFLKGEISFTEQRVMRIKEIFRQTDMSLNETDSLLIHREYLTEYENNWCLFDESKFVLDELENKYELGIISNGKQEQQIKKLNATGIINYFSTIVISSEIGIKKPDKRIFDHLIKKLNISPSHCYYIGDKPKTDIEGAENAGMNGIWINRKGENTELDILEIKSLNEIKKILKKKTTANPA